MNRQASSSASLGHDIYNQPLVRGLGRDFLSTTTTAADLPTRVYRVVLTRGTQEVTCTNVATDEGFVKFYNYVRSPSGINTCSVVAMYPSVNIQQITSVLEESVVIV